MCENRKYIYGKGTCAMKVYLNEISGLWDAIVGLYMSRRSWTRDLEEAVRAQYMLSFNRWGMRYHCEHESNLREPLADEMAKSLEKLCKWMPRHITLGRFIDFSFTVEGMHRGAQDDFDSHARRLDNRILRSSTRLARFGNEKSSWYQGKILTTDEACKALGVTLPEEVELNGEKYVAAQNGYVRTDLADIQDVRRGLYMLSIPSNFIFKVNATEFAHIVQQRDKTGHAHPELQEAVETMIDLIQAEIPPFTRDFWHSIKN